MFMSAGLPKRRAELALCVRRIVLAALFFGSFFWASKRQEQNLMLINKDYTCFPFFSYHEKKGTKKNHRLKSFSTTPVG